MGLVIIGIIAGIISGMGMGGGSILVVILTVFLNVEQHIAQASNLLFFIPTSIAAIIIYFKNKKVDTRIGLKLLYSVIIGATLGAMLAKNVGSSSLKKYFGIFLLVISVLDIFFGIKRNISKRGGKKK